MLFSIWGCVVVVGCRLLVCIVLGCSVIFFSRNGSSVILCCCVRLV